MHLPLVPLLALVLYVVGRFIPVKGKLKPLGAIATGLGVSMAYGATQGLTLETAVNHAVMGLLAGGGAVALHETTKKRKKPGATTSAPPTDSA